MHEGLGVAAGDAVCVCDCCSAAGKQAAAAAAAPITPESLPSSQCSGANVAKLCFGYII